MKFNDGDIVKVKKDNARLRIVIIPLNFYWNDVFVIEECHEVGAKYKEFSYTLKIMRTGEKIQGEVVKTGTVDEIIYESCLELASVTEIAKFRVKDEI